MKKIVSLLLIISVFISSFAFFDINTSAAENKTLIQFLVEKAKDYRKVVDISSYVRANNWKLDDIKLQLRYFYLSEPELFFVDREIAIQYSSDFSKVLLNLDYIYSESQAEKMLNKMKKAALKAVEGITDDMTSVEKALVVHDYIILNCAYDHKEEKFTAYDCLVNKSAVCQGYSLAFMYVMRDILGFDCTVAFSDTQNHSWNVIKIGKSWYHVDLTSDDPAFTAYGGQSYDCGGEVLHQNFLLSDDGAYKSSPLHRDWYALDVVKANNTKYDNAFWRKSSSAMFRVDGIWYYSYLDDTSPGLDYDGTSKKVYTKICTYDPETGKRKVIKKVESRWTVYRDSNTGKKLNGEHWYTKSFLKLVCINDDIYYNTSDAVYRIDTETGKNKRVYTLKKDNMQIFSMVPYDGARFRLVYKKDLSYLNKYITIKIS